jgi:hypothetical protein
MWLQGLAASGSESRVLRASDVFIVVLNESTAEVDVKSSAFAPSSADLTLDVEVSFQAQRAVQPSDFIAVYAAVCCLDN